jgi:hypothetical protein
MALPAKKGSADMLIALGGPKGLPGDDEGEESGPMSSDEPDMDSVKSMAADDVFDAVKSGDRALFADALDRYVQACVGE